VIRNWNPFVVWRKGLFGAEQNAGVSGVIDGRKEIGVIGNLAGEQQVDLVKRDQPTIRAARAIAEQFA
jgi:hypothetical protein